MVTAKAETKPMVRCWLCGELVKVKFSCKGKPYVIYYKCGVQVFVRNKRGAALLADKIRKESNYEQS